MARVTADPDTVPRPSLARNQRPIVLLGDEASRRRISGILDALPRISCPPGNGFVVYLERLTKTRGTRLAAFAGAEPSWPRRVAGFFGAIQAGYAAGIGKARWVAEVAGHEVDSVELFFPSAQVLYAVDPGNHRSEVRRARLAGSLMSSDRFLEIRHGDLLLRPETTVRDIADFLGEFPDGPALRKAGVMRASQSMRADDASR